MSFPGPVVQELPDDVIEGRGGHTDGPLNQEVSPLHQLSSAEMQHQTDQAALFCHVSRESLLIPQSSPKSAVGRYHQEIGPMHLEDPARNASAGPAPKVIAVEVVVRLTVRPGIGRGNQNRVISQLPGNGS